jgi:hypothetical protein
MPDCGACHVQVYQSSIHYDFVSNLRRFEVTHCHNIFSNRISNLTITQSSPKTPASARKEQRKQIITISINKTQRARNAHDQMFFTFYASETEVLRFMYKTGQW